MSGKKQTSPPNSFLLAETAKAFEIINWTGGHRQVFGRFGIVDLKTLSVRQAENLVKMEFSKIRKKEPTAPAKKSD